IFLGMPKGFNRTGGGLGDKPRLSLDIFKSFDEVWTELNQANMSWTPRPTNERNLTSNPTILTRTRK
ncbi:MAG TPA: hypothetical protein PK122_05715, partial [Candidatus Paceibacterota bacterium]|nr:hypothetical protein [Candidatus Paceibacterota bacterium]